MIKKQATTNTTAKEKQEKRAAIILAASREPNDSVFLREVLFCPACALAAQTCASGGVEHIYVITDQTKENVEQNGFLSAFDSISNAKVTLLHVKSGATMHIVAEIKKLVSSKEGFSDMILLRGDIPFIDSNVITLSFEHHKLNQTDATVLTTKSGDENRSAVWFLADSMKKALKNSTDFPERCPLHLLPDLLWQNSAKIDSYFADNPEFTLRISSARDVFELNTLLRKRVIDMHIEKGVDFLSTDGVLIGPDVKIGYGTQILPGTILKGNTVIGNHCVIGPNTLISSCKIGDNSQINASQAYQSTIGNKVGIGPFCHIRPNSIIESGVHIGDFVEVKNSTIGESTHISHLTYVGDSDVGKRVNFGCGVVTVNYNGKTKARCKVDDDAFIGCNTNLVAPVCIGKNAYTAAGSTITQDVPKDALAIARQRQTNKDGYNKK